MRPCPPWGFCASVVTPEQFVDGGCSGTHGYDGYVTRKQMEQEAREHGLAELVERANAFGCSS